MSSKIIAVVGPTASGKTGRAVMLAKAFNGEIVSADSRQVYRRMTIGTGKDLKEYGNVRYHLIDICEPAEKYNLFRYIRDAEKALKEIAERGTTPIVCGGSGMYAETLLGGMTMPEVPANEDLRRRLEGKTLEELTAMLASMKTLHNTTDVDTAKRAIRAIEIQTYYNAHPDEAATAANAKPKDALILMIDIPREIRRQRISRRLDARLKEGMIDEVKALLDEGIAAEDLIYYGLEYKFVTLHVLGKLTYEEMRQQLEIAIHQFAKRQMTWFRGMERRGFELNKIPFDISDSELIDRVGQLLNL